MAGASVCLLPNHSPSNPLPHFSLMGNLPSRGRLKLRDYIPSALPPLLHKDPEEFCPDHTIALLMAPVVPGYGIHKADPLSHRLQRCASSDKFDFGYCSVQFPEWDSNHPDGQKKADLQPYRSCKKWKNSHHPGIMSNRVDMLLLTHQAVRIYHYIVLSTRWFI